MATSRLADRQIRAAAQRAALRLDVRGPVSEALGKTGIPVPPAEAPPAPLATPDRQPEAPARPLGRGLQPTVKPLEPAPWPTRRAEPAPLTGLTADERRVHRILLDALDLTDRPSDFAGGIGYAERKRLEALDLPFINAQLAKMDRHGGASARATRWTVGVLSTVGGFLLALALFEPGAAAVGVLGATGVSLLIAAAVAWMFGVQTGPSADARRRKIYEALRELALLVTPRDDASDALAEADRLIDRLALGDLDGPTPDADRPAHRTRVRS